MNKWIELHQEETLLLLNTSHIVGVLLMEKGCKIWTVESPTPFVVDESYQQIKNEVRDDT